MDWTLSNQWNNVNQKVKDTAYTNLNRNSSLHPLAICLSPDMLFTAPELIRDRTSLSQEADIYSYAIICSQIITKKSAWDLENQDYDMDGTTQIRTDYWTN